MDLTCFYLGLTLPTPFVIGSSPMSDQVDVVKRLVECGASMVVMHSLFEEQFTAEQIAANWSMEHGSGPVDASLTDLPAAETFALGPQEYFTRITQIKKEVGIPVCGSLNGITPGNWVMYAEGMQQAGADAIELNVYDPSMDPAKGAESVEARTVEIVRLVRQRVRVPLAVKVGPFYTSFASFAARLDQEKVNGLVLFNRFLMPDIDLDSMETFRTLKLSTSDELPLRLRWVAALSGVIKADLAVTGGVHTGADVIKSILVGAAAVQLTSCLLRYGPKHLVRIREHIEEWLGRNHYTSLRELQGRMNLQHNTNRDAFERANYVGTLASRVVG